jgi:hypothetical protein
MSGKRIVPYEFTMGDKKVGSTLWVCKRYSKVVSSQEVQSGHKKFLVVVGFMSGSAQLCTSGP